MYHRMCCYVCDTERCGSPTDAWDTLHAKHHFGCHLLTVAPRVTLIIQQYFRKINRSSRESRRLYMRFLSKCHNMSRSKRSRQEADGICDGESASVAKDGKEPMFKDRYATSFAAEDPYIAFYSKSSDERARNLSNFSSHQICIDFKALHPDAAEADNAVVYPTGEHAFHGAKFRLLSLHTASTARKEELHQYSCQFEGSTLRNCIMRTASAAKSAGGKNGLRLSPEELAMWERASMVVQEQICRWKIKDEGLKDYLLSTGSTYLVHFERATGWPRYGATILYAENSPFDDGRRWMKGDNCLGLLWMKLRDELVA